MSSLFHSIQKFYRNQSRTRLAVLILLALAMASFIATYLLIAQSGSVFSVDAHDILMMIILDLVLVLSLAVIASKRLSKMLTKRRKAISGSRLQSRIVFVASLMAAIPTIIIVISSVLFFNFGLQAWFDNKVVTAIDNSVAVAKSYLSEHKKIIQADLLGIANDLNRDAYNIRKNPQNFNQKLDILASVRKLPEALVFQAHADHGSKSDKRVLAHTRFTVALQMILEDLPPEMIVKAQNGEIVTYTTETEERVFALVRLESYFDTYLLVARFVDDEILSYIEVTEGAAAQYQRLRADISQVQIEFYLIFLGGALLLVLAAIWGGYVFASQLVQPVAKLMDATEKVKKGDWQARVDISGPKNDELVILGQAFNDMASQLESQRDELISAQRRSAWSDVARRIAHEIKNPLTPIQLSAERLKKKYTPLITDEKDRKQFERYVSTISRNVGDIGQMVEEFANFARLPAPVFRQNDFASLVKDILFSHKELSENTIYHRDIPDTPCERSFDEHQLSRVLTNLLKNAEESIEERRKQEGEGFQGKIDVSLRCHDTMISVIITDNGTGFDNELLSHITEPYVTTKSKGTGLGLAIVKKIIEDHQGTLSFENRKEGGAKVTLAL